MEQCEDCAVFAKEKLIIGFGIKDIVVVDAGDVMLVMDKNRDQEIKHLVNKLGDEKFYEIMIIFNIGSAIEIRL